MFIDTHLHLSYKDGISPEEFIRNAKEASVEYLILSCCDKDSIVEGLELIEKYDNLFLSVGFHPEFATSITKEDLIWLEEVIKSSKRIVAVGEIGLDFHYGKDTIKEQENLFVYQLELANKYKLPVVIHTRDAIQMTYDMLSNYSLKGVIHCYSGSVEMALKFVDLGYYLGIGGVVTFSNSKLYEVVKVVGLSSILLETDSPYLAPSPYRGKINESKYIPVIAERISNILDIDVLKVARITTNNACDLFDLNIKI